MMEPELALVLGRDQVPEVSLRGGGTVVRIDLMAGVYLLLTPAQADALCEQWRQVKAGEWS